MNNPAQTMLGRVREILKAEADAIVGMPLDDSVDAAIQAIFGCSGKIFTTGIGKAGYVAQKASSTFSTTGTPSVFLHPADAPHGNVGAVQSNDLLIAFSNSGKTREVLETIGFCRTLGLETVISVTSHPESPIAVESDIALSIGNIVEPCPLQLTPTASSTAMIALMDALALTVMELRGFSREQFSLRHHGGYLGQKSRGDLK